MDDLRAAGGAGEFAGRMCLRNWLFFCPSFKVYLASKRNTPQKTFLRHLMELGRFQVSLARKSLKCVSHPEPEAWLGLVQPPGRVGCGVDRSGQGQLLRIQVMGPRGDPLSNPTAGHLENELEFWPDFTNKFIPSGSCKPLLSFL